METQIKERIEQAIDDLHYDFRQFVVDDFIQHIQRKRQRDIFHSPFPFTAELHGMWVQRDTIDYVLYDRDTHSIHKTHHILHELGHMVLGHKLIDLAEILPPDLIAQLSSIMSLPLLGHCRTYVPFDTPEDREAEIFVFCLRERIWQADRFDELTHPASSIHALNPFVKRLGV